MTKKAIKFFLFTIFLSLFSVYGNAQVENCYRIGENRQEPYPEQIQERLTELCIERAKKDFQDLLDKSEEVAKLTEEVEISYEKNNKLSSDDAEKLEKVETLLKKIRKDLRADDDDEDFEEKPNSILEAIKSLKEKTSGLFEELKKTSRYSISAVAIQSSNSVLKLVKFLRFKD